MNRDMSGSEKSDGSTGPALIRQSSNVNRIVLDKEKLDL